MRAWHRDPLYFACIVVLAGVAVMALARDVLSPSAAMQIGALGALAGLLSALALALRHRRRARIVATLLGALVTLACGGQLAFFIITGAPAPVDFPLRLPPWNFSAGMLCVGLAVLLDGALPQRWGRYWLFGLLGAVALALGGLSLLGAVTDLPLTQKTGPNHGDSLPCGLILLCAGMALMAASPIQPATSPRERSGFAAATLVMLVTLIATALVWRESVQHAYAQEHTLADESLSRFSNALATEALAVMDLLDGLRGLFAASEGVTAEEWANYLRYVHVRPNYESVFALGYAEQVGATQRSADGSYSVGPDRSNTLRIWPDAQRDNYFPLVYFHPDGEVGRQNLGYDLASSAAFRDALQGARDSGRIGISRKVDFEHFHDPDARAGFVLMAPVERGSAHTGSDFPRFGVVMAALDIRVLVERVRARVGEPMLAVHITEGAGGLSSTMYADTDFRDDLPAQSRMLDIAGQTWQVSAQVRTHATAAYASRVPAAVLAGGVFCALALFALSWVLVGHRERALRLADRMTTELRRSQRQQRAINDTANAAILIADAEGRVVYMNPFALRTFEVTEADIVGQSLALLMPQRHRDRSLRWLQYLRGEDCRRLRGRPMELVGLRQDGSELPLEVLLSSWRSDGQLFFAAFMRDISRRKRSEAALAHKTRELLRSNAELEQFAYVASHDLQEPLRMVSSYLELLSQRYRGHLDRDADEFIGFAVDGATRMQQLIGDLLDYAQLGRSQQASSAVSLSDCIDAAVTQLQRAIQDNGARIHVDAEGEVMASSGQLVRVFQNLIANALKFRGAAVPEINVSAQREGAYWHVQVRDNGIGIEPVFHQRVFAIFQRLHTRSEYSGTGIGLAICRKIIEDLHGRIWIESADAGGSVFHFTLPAVADQA